jgi:hypothetical protein
MFIAEDAGHEPPAQPQIRVAMSLIALPFSAVTSLSHLWPFTCLGRSFPAALS